MTVTDKQGAKGNLIGEEDPPPPTELELIRDLQAREAELALIHRIAGVGRIEVDLRDGFRSRKSPEYLNIHGLPPSAASETHEEWVARIHPDDRAQAEKKFIDAVAGDTTEYSAEYRIIRSSDGQLRWIRVAARIERDSSGRALRLIGAHLDVTDMMLAQEALRESEQRFRLIANNAPVPMWVTKLDGERLFVNKAYQEFFGLSYVDALRFDWRRRIHPDDAAVILNPDQLSKLVSGVQGTDPSALALELRVLRADGEWRWIKSVSQPRFDERGQHVGFIGVAQDITIAKQAEIEFKQANDKLEDRIRTRTAQLEAREAQMRAVLETSNQYLWLLDPSGLVQYANRTALASIRADTSDRPELVFWDTEWFATDLPSSERVGEMFAAASTGSTQQDELTLSLPIGVRVLEFNLRPITDTTGAISGVLCEAIDITERRRNEEYLRQSQKMEAIGQLTGGVAHDFNNLLTIISSATEFLKNPNLPPDRRERYVDLISNTVSRATKLTSQLLAFARRHPVSPVIFDAGRQVESTAQMLQPLLGSRVQVSVEIAEQGCLVRADVGQFETAILNLALNARDAMPDGGRLTLRVKRIGEIPWTREHRARVGNFAEISVSDTGSGIPADLLDKIFEPFFTTKQVGKGTGLGLSQVFGFSKQSGGDIEVISQQGQGSTFIVYLPLADSLKGDVPASVAQSSRPRAELLDQVLAVLVVEDNEDVGRLVSEQLQAEGFKVSLVSGAEAALLRLAQSDDGFDIIFSDIVMPGMNGIDFANVVREKYPQLSIVLTTGHSDAWVENTTREFALVRKPYSMEELIAGICAARTSRLGPGQGVGK